MRIIDSKRDFYDYLQSCYGVDDKIVFDRRDSFMLTRESICKSMSIFGDSFVANKDPVKFMLLQVGYTFWLFTLVITEHDEVGRPSNYSVELVRTWKNYSAPRVLISFAHIAFTGGVATLICTYKKNSGRLYDLKKIEGHGNDLVAAINQKEYRVICDLSHQRVDTGCRKDRDYDKRFVTRTIPLFISSGFANKIDPLTIYTSLEEYFTSSIQDMERTESIGLTDREKVENHGFDLKTSFRGKN